MYKYYYFTFILFIVFVVNTVNTLPALELKKEENEGTLPALIPERNQMPSGTVLSNLQQQEKMTRDVQPESVPQETIDYFKSMIEILKLSYCTSVIEDGDCKSCPPEMTLIQDFPSTLTNDFSGAILRDDSKKTYYLLFTGTKSFQNIVTDIEMVSVDYEPVGHGTKLHYGVYSSYLTTQTLIQTTMLNEMSKNTDYQVIVMGHSLGGAITNIAVLDLYQRNKFLNEKNLRSITASAPSMWNRELSYYAASTNINMIRLTHANDLVASSRDVLKITGYVHSGVEYWNKESDSVVCCPSKFETPNCINTRTFDPLKFITPYSGHDTFFGQRITECDMDKF